MDIQIRIGNRLTAEQEAQLERYYAAAKLLRAGGFECKVRECVVFGPKDDPAYIDLVRTK